MDPKRAKTRKKYPVLQPSQSIKQILVSPQLKPSLIKVEFTYWVEITRRVSVVEVLITVSKCTNTKAL